MPLRLTISLLIYLHFLGLLLGQSEKDPFALPPREENGVKIYFFAYKVFPGPIYYFKGYLQNTSNTEIVVAGCEGTIEAVEIPRSFVISKKLRYVGDGFNPGYFDYEDLLGKELKEPSENHYPVTLKPSEVGLLFNIEITKESMDRYRKDHGWSEYEHMDEVRGAPGFWDNEKWMLIYSIDEDFGKMHGVWSGEIVTFSEDPGRKAIEKSKENQSVDSNSSKSAPSSP